MRVDKKFAPIIITIETEEDKTFLLEVINKACRYYLSHGSIFCSPRKDEDAFIQKCTYFERQIQ